MKSATRRTAKVSNIIASLDLSRLLAIANLFAAFHQSLFATTRTEDREIPLALVVAGAAAVKNASRVDSLYQPQAEMLFG